MNPLVAEAIGAELQEAIGALFGFLPDLIVAIAVLAIGYVVGGRLQGVVRRTGQRARLDEKVQGTALGPLFPDRAGAVSEAFGAIVKYYVFLLALVVAAEHLGIGLLTQWLTGAVSYLPSLIAGVVILVVGLFIADYVADVVRRSTAAREAGFSATFAAATKAVLYFVVVVIGLETMGVDVTILYTFAEAFALALALAFALAVGIAVGWGGKEYVAENLEGWLDSSREVASDGSEERG